MKRLALLAGVFALAAVNLPTLAGSVSAPADAAAPTSGVKPAQSTEVARGRSLFVSGCSYCHALDANGVPGRAPSLVGAGAAAADFYLSTGRMPLADPRAFPVRSKPAYPRSDITALVAYVASLGGPPIPTVSPLGASPSLGLSAFTENCAGCHQVSARGGIVTGSVAPSLQQASATQIAEAVRVGPYLMPNFSPTQIDQRTLNAIARYVLPTRHPDDRGGWGIGHIGPIPEGMIAWCFALAILLIVSRIIGEGSPRDGSPRDASSRGRSPRDGSPGEGSPRRGSPRGGATR